VPIRPQKSDAWTVESVYAHFARRFKDIERLYDARFKADTLIGKANRQAIDIAIKAVEQTATTARQYGEKAIEKAETANDKRWDAANEIKAAMKDQQATFATKEEMDQRCASNAEKIAELTAWRGRIEGRDMGKGEATTSHQVSANFIVTIIMALIAIAAVMVAILKH
jgi:hypothetical protein